MISVEALAAVEAQVQHALESGDESKLRVIGYGEVSTVLQVSTTGGDFACKRLPRFATRGGYDRFAALLERYLVALDRGGVKPARTEVVAVPAGGDGVVGYCVQPSLPVEALASRILARASDSEGAALIERIFAALQGGITPRVGIDGQLSNWAFVGDGLLYLDITTPLLRDAEGRDALDYGVFVASLPWFLRGGLERFVAPGIAAKYFDLRQVLRDFVANLFKERLARWVPVSVAMANNHVTPRITEDEARAYYRSDARMWAVLQRLRKWDRAWQRKVRRRQYPFLLPGDIQR